MENTCYPFVNLPLPYPYHGLEPFIDRETMYLHHDRHLQTYIDNLNGILRQHPGLQKPSLERLIQCASSYPKELQMAIRNNAGGVYNHRFFFRGLKNPAPGEPMGALGKAIQEQFGGFGQFREQWKAAALSVFGSGYAWLVLEGTCLRIITTQNQNSPVERGLWPILTIDVWEHAYYLKHYNVRADYIEDWMHVIDWEQAKKRFLACTSCR